MTHHAAGSFDVRITPQSPTTDPCLGRMDIDKSYHGDLVAHATGTMLTAMGADAVKATAMASMSRSSALPARWQASRGSFALAHKGVIDHGKQSLVITIVPGSGTAALEGIAGSLDIIIKDGGRFYTMDYTLPK